MEKLIKQIDNSLKLVKAFKPEDTLAYSLLDKIKARAITGFPNIVSALIALGEMREDSEEDDKNCKTRGFIAEMTDRLTKIILHNYRIILRGKSSFEKEYEAMKLPRKVWMSSSNVVREFKESIFLNFNLILDEEDVEKLIDKLILCEDISLFEQSGINIAIPYDTCYDEKQKIKITDLLNVGDELKSKIELGAGAYAVTGGPSAGKSLFITELNKVLGENAQLIKILEPGYKGEAELSLTGIGETLSEAFNGKEKVILVDSFRFSSVLLKSIALKNGISAAAFAIATTLTIIAERTNKIVFFVISSETDEKEINNIFFQRLVGACSGVFAPQYGTFAGIASIRDSDRKPFAYSLIGRSGEIQKDMVQAFDYVNYSRELYSSIGGVKMIEK